MKLPPSESGQPLPDLETVLGRIREPKAWAEHEALLQAIREVPSLRGMVYGNVAEVEFSRWLAQAGVPADQQSRDDDHLKTKSDRTFCLKGRRYTVQLKSMQTNSIRESAGAGAGATEPGFTAAIQCDASDRREILLPSGRRIHTTCYLAGEFDILAVGLHPFLGRWEFAFALNSQLPRSSYARYAPEDAAGLLKTLVRIQWPLPPNGIWTRDLMGLLAANPQLGEPLEALQL